MKTQQSFIENIIYILSYAILMLTLLVAGVAFFSTDTSEEAYLGNFETSTLDTWELEKNGTKETITLPYKLEFEPGDVVSITSTLPETISNQSNLMTRARMADLYIYVDGELREEYSSESFSYMSYYLPSAYVVTTLSSKDAGKEIVIELRLKGHGTINEVTIGPGNNVWFPVLNQHLPVNIVAVVVFILGIMLFFFAVIMRHRAENYSNAPFYLSLLMVDLSLWVLSESNLRQLIFAKPSFSQYFAYVSVYMISLFAAMYFDEVQHRHYHGIYFVFETIIIIDIVINLILHFSHTLELYQTLTVSHIISVLCLLFAAGSIVNDIRIKRIGEYSATSIGMLCLLITGGVEMVAFYAVTNHKFGIFISFGLIILMTATLVQTMMDQEKESKAREMAQNETVMNTIKTIAGTIDAKDEYTGGHSDRVGRYSEILARGMAAYYGFSEDDISRIRYIGTMHDIGKIGVPDNVLNKAGKLTDEEFALMKKHAEIGSDLLHELNANIEGLVDGVRHHHERFDGRGYPDGLKETEIPLVARIICLADCYDAMTSNRVYRKRLDDATVREEIIRCSGTQFDPALTEIFVRLIDEGEIYPLS